jgi:hypothetical protein
MMKTPQRRYRHSVLRDEIRRIRKERAEKERALYWAPPVPYDHAQALADMAWALAHPEEALAQAKAFLDACRPDLWPECPPPYGSTRKPSPKIKWQSPLKDPLDKDTI